MPYRARILIVLAGSLVLGCMRERPAAREYLIVLIDESPADGADSADAPPVDDAWLRPCCPNPFRGCTSLDLDLLQSGPVRLAIYDVVGRRLAVLVDGHRTVGRHRITWCGSDTAGRRAPAGIYFARLSTTERRESRRMVLVR